MVKLYNGDCLEIMPTLDREKVDLNFIGIERDDHYFKVAQERIKQAENELASMLF